VRSPRPRRQDLWSVRLCSIFCSVPDGRLNPTETSILMYRVSALVTWLALFFHRLDPDKRRMDLVRQKFVAAKRLASHDNLPSF
jgi:hypothetical protein